ncbi:hypothetical protein JTE90_023813 [Oedothorax gibbosus]|uniref:Uncharacterized protein n=1 Tax=Oedothorax gibbosus TaxID=931172 RepID=A0AAV6VHM1_9ARAC|nr:hypothetical protein JTE90_023813 [Oedothorax gibbosus]
MQTSSQLQKTSLFVHNTPYPDIRFTSYCLSESKKIQTCQNKIRREMVYTHQYVRNDPIQRYLNIKTISEYMDILNDNS